MKNRIVRSIVIATICTATVTHAWDSNENNIWIEGTIKGNLSDKLDLKLTEQIRYKEEGFDYSYRHTELCFSWEFLPGWSLTPAYRYAVAIKNNATVSTPIWHLNLCNKYAWAGVDFNSRMRIFYSNFNNSEDQTDFRPKLTLIPSRGWTPLKLKPYIEDELMMNLNEGRFYLNRLSTGLKCNPLKSLTCCAFLMQDLYENKAQTAWNERYHYGISACLTF